MSSSLPSLKLLNSLISSFSFSESPFGIITCILKNRSPPPSPSDPGRPFPFNLNNDPDWVYWDKNYYDLVINTYTLNQEDAFKTAVKEIEKSTEQQA